MTNLRKASYLINVPVDFCYCVRLGSAFLAKSVGKPSEMTSCETNTPADWTKEAIPPWVRLYI